MSEQKITPQIEASWLSVLQPEFEKPYFTAIKQFLVEEKQKGTVIFPPGPLIFNAFNLTPFEAVKVVILGQDPYINQGEAMGLSFSVPNGIKIPASLQKIFKELHNDTGVAIPSHGNLTAWAERGVFLLNASLTVAQKQSNSHQHIGWQKFTDAVISVLSEKREGIVFMLWGNNAKAKRTLINADKHLILEAAHPSPLAGNAFLGCRHFSKANEYLVKKGQEPINWSI